MPRVVALIPDLMFGSRVKEALGAAGHEVVLVSRGDEARAELAGADVLVIDLVDDALDGASLLQSMRSAGELGGARSLGFYAHVDSEVRRSAQEAGFDLVVPRSRMAREAAALIEGLAARSA